MEGAIDREYLQYRAADMVSNLLPRRFAYWVGLRVADSLYARDEKGRAAVISNLRQILAFKGVDPSEETLDGMARKTFQHFGKYVVDFFRFSRLTPSNVRRMVSIEHPEYLEEAVARGKGGLLVSAHLGSWELGAAVLATMGYHINAVVLPQKNRRTNALFQSRRRRRGLNVIPLGQAARGIIKALKNKELAALLADRDYSPHADTVPFFGSPARLPTGPARLSYSMGVPIVPGVLLRQEDDTFLMRLHRPLYPESYASTAAIQTEIGGILENWIGETPSQWFMFEEFWKLNNHNNHRNGGA